MKLNEQMLETFAKLEEEFLEKAENEINEMPEYKEVEDKKNSARDAFYEKLKAKAPELCTEFNELEDAFLMRRWNILSTCIARDSLRLWNCWTSNCCFFINVTDEGYIWRMR